MLRQQRSACADTWGARPTRCAGVPCPCSCSSRPGSPAASAAAAGNAGEMHHRL